MNRRREAGSASVLTLVFGAAVLAVSGVLVVIIVIVTGEHRAASTADLAALAAASRLSTSPATACAAAGEVARANHGRLLSCEVAADAVTVSVGLTPGHTWFDSWLSQIVGRARAGYS